MKRLVGGDHPESSTNWSDVAPGLFGVTVALAAELTYEALYLILYAAIAILMLRNRLRRTAGKRG